MPWGRCAAQRGPPRPRGDRPRPRPRWLPRRRSSPPARGSSVPAYVDVPYPGVLPARAGIVLAWRRLRRSVGCPPRPRGDRPDLVAGFIADAPSSPPARGSSSGAMTQAPPERVLPARAGIVRRRAATGRTRRSPPRPRGDRPIEAQTNGILDQSSPPARGSSARTCPHRSRSGVLPARAGIVLGRAGDRRPARGPPRPRGDRPSAVKASRSVSVSSPPARGSSGQVVGRRGCDAVLPAHAGIVRSRRPCPARPTGPPRPRGDRPNRYDGDSWAWTSSPPARGSSPPGLCPARAGIVRCRRAVLAPVDRPPRPRGDRPRPPGPSPPSKQSSPPARRSSGQQRVRGPLDPALPARRGSYCPGARHHCHLSVGHTSPRLWT